MLLDSRGSVELEADVCNPGAVTTIRDDYIGS